MVALICSFLVIMDFEICTNTKVIGVTMIAQLRGVSRGAPNSLSTACKKALGFVSTTVLMKLVNTTRDASSMVLQNL